MKFSLLLWLAHAVLALPGNSLEYLRSDHQNLSKRDLQIGTCNAQTPCPNGACCGSNGLCGYSPAECGPGCSSNCDAKAQCGQYGTPGTQNCPLNVCCSQFGFCGSTNDFCGIGCQQGFGGCGPPPTPPCGGSKVGQRTIGYYESWANTRKCQAVNPEDLNLAGFTHLNFAFASFDPNSFYIAPMDSNSASLFARVTGLKSQWPGLQVWISVGGWAFTDPGPTQEAFSNMVSTSSNRLAFIKSLQQFMQTYDFDGVDLDWEYPQADDRGGQPGDRANYVTFAQELRLALGPKGLSMTLPTSYWYLQHFDVQSLQDSVDWFNFMAYDLHGVWDRDSKFVGPYIAPHTNLTEIDEGLQLLWRAGVQADKVVLGQGWYGRSFTLRDSSCTTPNGVCQFSGGGNAGPCSDTVGILDNQEIQDIITQNSLQPTWDYSAGVKWINWDSNQWVSYDDPDTFDQKRQFAESRCLGGLMVWAIDQKDQGTSGNLNSGTNATVSPSDQMTAQSMSNDQLARASCYVTGCNENCKKGTNKVAQMNGQPGQVSTRNRCPVKQYRSLCCDDGTTMGKCQWRGYRGAGLSCIQGCAEGENELTTDTNNHKGKRDQTCNGGLQSYCCAGFKSPPSKGQVAQDASDAGKAAAEQAAEQAGLDIVAKAFCRLMVPALLAPLEALEDLIPIIGEIADLAEVAATPELIKICTEEIEKNGKAEFKVFGKEHGLDPKDPGEIPPETRSPQSSHAPEKTSSQCDSKRAGERCLAERTVTKTNQPIKTEFPGVIRTCDGHDYPQACLHYRSVISVNNIVAPFTYNPITCPTHNNDQLAKQRSAPVLWNEQHNPGWWKGYIQEPNQYCQLDEYPPAAWWYEKPAHESAFIRLLPRSDNAGAGSGLFGKRMAFCRYDAKDDAPTSVHNLRYSTSEIIGNRKTYISTLDLTTTLSTISIHFTRMPVFADDGLTENPCWPSTVIDDPGFALLTNDGWYAFHPQQAANTPAYAQPPQLQLTQGKFRGGYSKRDEDIIAAYTFSTRAIERDTERTHFEPEMILLDDGNSTRRATEEDLAEYLNLHRCATPDCHQEIEENDVEAVIVDSRLLDVSAPNLDPIRTEAFLTTQEVLSHSTGTSAASGAEQLVPSLPEPTY